MKKAHKIFASCFATLLLCSVPALAIDMTINPYIGTGSVSDGSKVKSATGLRANLGQSFAVSDRILIGPRIEIGNNYVNTRSSVEDRRLLSTYDNRYFVAGGHIGVLLGSLAGLHREVYANLSGGRALSKLSQDESGAEYFAQKEYSDIRGRYMSGELGLNVSVKRNVAFNISMLNTYYKADATRAIGNVSGEVATKGGKVFGLSEENATNRVPTKLVQKITYLSFGLTLDI